MHVTNRCAIVAPGSGNDFLNKVRKCLWLTRVSQSCSLFLRSRNTLSIR